MFNQSLATTNTLVVEKNKVLRNTYLLLGMTLLFSAATAIFSVYINAAHPNIMLFFLGAYGLMFLTHVLKNSFWGIVAVFCFTGFMGYILGPLLNSVLVLNNGGMIVAVALGATAIIFLGLSGHVMVSGKDYSYLGGFLFISMMTIFVAMIASIIFKIAVLHLAVSCAFVLFSSAMILFQTSQIINGGEKNYIIATISLYVSIYNLFVSLLHILSAFSRR